MQLWGNRVWMPKRLTDLDSLEVEVVAANRLQFAFRSSHKFRNAMNPNVNCDLEVVLLLTDKSIIWWWEVETFVCIHAIRRSRPGINKKIKSRERLNKSSIGRREGHFNLQVFSLSINQGDPFGWLISMPLDHLVSAIQEHSIVWQVVAKGFRVLTIS